MPYDLYGQYYSSRRDAENAEMAQCAQISADINEQKIMELERRLYEQQAPTYEEEQINNLWQHIKSLEERILKLEGKQ